MSTFRERLAFDAAAGEYRDGPIRYMMIRPDALMGIMLELPEAMRPAFLDALARAVAHRGGQSAAHYQTLGAADADALLATVAATAPELGWGTWTFARTVGGLSLSVANSPFVAGTGASAGPVCHAIAGMLRAVGGLVLGAGAVARETSCAAVHGAGACRFVVEPAA